MVYDIAIAFGDHWQDLQASQGCQDDGLSAAEKCHHHYLIEAAKLCKTY